MAIKKFEPSKIGSVIRSRSSVTVSKNGRIYLNQALVRELPAKRAYCEMYVDDDPAQMVIRLHAEAGNDTSRVCYDKSGVTISARRFLAWAGIDRTESRVYRAKYSEKAMGIVVDMRAPVAVSGEGRLREA